MSPWHIFLIIATFVLASIVKAQPDVHPIGVCGLNAEWSICQTPCAPSCDSINNPNPVRCYSLLCRSGCNCKKGYVRRSDNSEECILRDDCLNNRLIETKNNHKRPSSGVDRM